MRAGLRGFVFVWCLRARVALLLWAGRYGENRYGGTWLWEDGDWLTTSDLPAWPQ
eukprot:COSAG02_NODE_63525_length_263_cov_0.615854_1_plen_54_part_10